MSQQVVDCCAQTHNVVLECAQTSIAGIAQQLPVLTSAVIVVDRHQLHHAGFADRCLWPLADRANATLRVTHGLVLFDG